MKRSPVFVTQPFLPPLDEFVPYLEKIWASRVLTNGGPFHQQLEKALADYLGVGHLSLFANGTVALAMPLMAKNIRPGDAVFCPSFTFAATAEVVAWLGASPVFVDVLPDTFNMDPASLEDYLNHGGYVGLRNALAMSGADVVQAVTDSGLRGRGGAAFPTGIKWKTVLGAAADQKYVVCNADEGDSGTFADRMLMEGDPLSLIEGMIICGYAINGTKGYVYLRSEYPQAATVFQTAIEAARKAGWLGDNVRGSGFKFDIELRIGAGAYVCGEETSLLESLEGKRGIVRAKPPLPAHEGLFVKPTVVNNVLSMGTVPMILEKGAQHYADLGVGRSRGTMPLQIAGNVKYGGLFETDFGIPLGTIVNDIAGGTRLGVSAGVTAVLVAIGFLVRATEPSLARLRGFVWLAGSAAAWPSRAPSRPGPTSCCMTSPRPGSIPSRR